MENIRYRNISYIVYYTNYIVYLIYIPIITSLYHDQELNIDNH